MVSELLDTISFLRLNNIEPAQNQIQTPEMIQHYATKTPDTLPMSHPHTALLVQVDTADPFTQLFFFCAAGPFSLSNAPYETSRLATADRPT